LNAVTFQDIQNKLFALVIWNMDKEDDVHVYVGHIVKDGIDYVFKNDEKGWTVPIDAEKLETVKKVSDDLKEALLNADFAINLRITSSGDDPGPFIPTGMKWH
jgi:hypothetical protein